MKKQKNPFIAFENIENFKICQICRDFVFVNKKILSILLKNALLQW